MGRGDSGALGGRGTAAFLPFDTGPRGARGGVPCAGTGVGAPETTDPSWVTGRFPVCARPRSPSQSEDLSLCWPLLQTCLVSSITWGNSRQPWTPCLSPGELQMFTASKKGCHNTFKINVEKKPGQQETEFAARTLCLQLHSHLVRVCQHRWSGCLRARLAAGRGGGANSSWPGVRRGGGVQPPEPTPASCRRPAHLRWVAPGLLWVWHNPRAFERAILDSWKLCCVAVHVTQTGYSVRRAQLGKPSSGWGGRQGGSVCSPWFSGGTCSVGLSLEHQLPCFLSLQPPSPSPTA